MSPSFQAATPSCIQGPRGELLAVRSDADALSLADRARAAGEETGSNPLLLLDLVDLQVGAWRAARCCTTWLRLCSSIGASWCPSVCMLCCVLTAKVCSFAWSVSWGC